MQTLYLAMHYIFKIGLCVKQDHWLVYQQICMQCTTRKTCFVDANIIFSNASVVVLLGCISIRHVICHSLLFQNKWGAKRPGCFFSENPVISYISPLERRKKSQQCSQISQNQKVFKTQTHLIKFSRNTIIWAILSA